jgi:hypothetical protein
MGHCVISRPASKQEILLSTRRKKQELPINEHHAMLKGESAHAHV